ncbi:hypothetical protein MS5214_51370 [Klebsiella pneumoniae]|nr:hypothetical protein MS5214_51370 [Klebsiella pneumoniae]
MKCLAIADLFINAAMMESGLKALRDNGIEVEVREWSHDSVEKLQEDNLRVEQEGAEAVALPEALLQGTDDIDILITQFAPVNTAVFDKLPKLKYVGASFHAAISSGKFHGIICPTTPSGSWK